MTEGSRKAIVINEQAAVALTLGVAKWSEIVDDLANDVDPDSCSSKCKLCQLYNPYRSKDPLIQKMPHCSIECPIKQDTGCDFCEGTPYDDWNEEDEYGVSIGETIENAQTFLNYLIDLRRRCKVE